MGKPKNDYVVCSVLPFESTTNVHPELMSEHIARLLPYGSSALPSKAK